MSAVELDWASVSEDVDGEELSLEELEEVNGGLGPVCVGIAVGAAIMSYSGSAY